MSKVLVKTSLKNYVNYGIINFVITRENAYITNKGRKLNKLKCNNSNNNLEQLFYRIEKELEENEAVLNKLLEIDAKYAKFNVEFEELKQIINKFKNQKAMLEKDRKIKIHYNGNPYITLNLCILSIITNVTLFLEFNNYMLGVNTLIVKIINNILNDFNMAHLIHISQSTEENLEKIICIDDINLYNSYVRDKNEKVKFYSLEYTDFYCDTSEFEELVELIYQYVEERQIPLEVYSELDVEEAVSAINNGIGKRVVLISNSEYTKEVFLRNIKDKKLYINKQPFNQKIMLLDKEIFL